MKRLLYFSLLLNLLLAGAMASALYRLGGWRYALLRLQRDTAGLYHHRVEHFERLPERPGSIVFLGDSQVAQAEWHELFGDQPTVLNRGISGDYTAAVMERLPEIWRHKPLKIFLLVGINDLIFGRDPAQIEPAYRALVQKIRSDSPDSELYLLSVLPVNNDLRRSGARNEDIAALNASIRRVGSDFAVPYVDLASLLSDADGRMSPKFSEDGLHLNGLGYMVVKKELERFMVNQTIQPPQ